jgi:hypothetical protein
MVQEHFIEQFGRPIHTIGVGGSGGAIQVQLIAQNYPGLLDGIIPRGSFPDVLSPLRASTDCKLLSEAFAASKQSWTEAQKTAVSGFATWRTCRDNAERGARFVDPRNCDRSMPTDAVYDPNTNAQGVRCDFFGNEVNVFGRDPESGLAHRPLDNVGVQYGLIAFTRGKISPEQFVELNEKIGGFDRDGNTVPRRTEATAEAIRIAYRRGLVLTGGGGLNQVPIIDANLWYSDDLADSHDHVRALITRARLQAAQGSTGNHVILVNPRPEILPFLTPDGAGEHFAMLAQRDRSLILTMDRWLDAIEADSGTGLRLERISRNRPAGLADGCLATDGERIVEPATFDGSGRCNQMYPVHGDPQIAAGAPETNDILKCVLKPLDPADYSQPLSATQLERLKSVFPTGVCDYSRRGVGQQITEMTWQRYE